MKVDGKCFLFLIFSLLSSKKTQKITKKKTGIKKRNFLETEINKITGKAKKTTATKMLYSDETYIEFSIFFSRHVSLNYWNWILIWHFYLSVKENKKTVTDFGTFQWLKTFFSAFQNKSIFVAISFFFIPSHANNWQNQIATRVLSVMWWIVYEIIRNYNANTFKKH